MITTHKINQVGNGYRVEAVGETLKVSLQEYIQWVTEWTELRLAPADVQNDVAGRTKSHLRGTILAWQHPTGRIMSELVVK